MLGHNVNVLDRGTFIYCIRVFSPSSTIPSVRRARLWP